MLSGGEQNDRTAGTFSASVPAWSVPWHTTPTASRENVAPGATPGPGASSTRGAFRCARPARVVLPFPPGRPGGGSSAVRRPASLPRAPGAGLRVAPTFAGRLCGRRCRRPLWAAVPVLNPGGPVAPWRAAGGPGLALRAPCGARAAAVSAAAARLPLWAWRWLLPGFPPPSPGGFGASGPPGVWGSGGPRGSARLGPGARPACFAACPRSARPASALRRSARRFPGQSTHKHPPSESLSPCRFPSPLATAAKDPAPQAVR